MMDNDVLGLHGASPPSVRKTCVVCRKTFHVYPYQEHSAKYCSVRCMGIGYQKFRGNLSNRWKGGRCIHKSGYVTVWTPVGRVYEHRLIAERMLGRPLQQNETVHHRNGVRWDNRRKNLQILPREVHNRVQTQKRWEGNKPFRREGPLCGKPRRDRHGKGRLCQRLQPCSYHTS